MKLAKAKGWHWLLALIFVLSSLGVPVEEAAVTAKDDENPPPTEHWQKVYKDFHELVTKMDEQVSRNYFPEFMIIKEGHTIATIQVDVFGAKVLKEADDVLLPYREGIAKCVERRQNEYKAAKTYSYERFGWFLDRYVRAMGKAIGGAEEKTPSKGIREKKVATDRSLYAITRLAAAYLQERRERFKNSATDAYAADRAVETAITDIGRRVLRLDLTQKFDRRELLEKGVSSQPVFRDLASHESGPNIETGIEPLSLLAGAPDNEPPCEITLSLPRISKAATAE